MKEGIILESLEGAVEQFICLLSVTDRQALVSVASISPLLKGGAEFIGRALRELHLESPAALSLLTTIHASCPDRVTNMDFMATSAEPLLAAQLIVERAQMELRERGRMR